MVTEAIEKVQIVVDDRERPSGVVAELEKSAGVVVKIEHLALGDYCVDGAVLIERKTAADFARSLIDGRLFGQAARMTASSLRPAYILGGSSAEWFGLGVSREALQGALVTLMLIFDVPVFRSSDPAESARLMIYLGSQLSACATRAMCHTGRPKRSGKRLRKFASCRACPVLGWIAPSGCSNASARCVPVLALRPKS